MKKIYYKASLFESAALMFPAGIRSNHKVVIRFVKELLADELKELTDLEKQNALVHINSSTM